MVRIGFLFLAIGAPGLFVTIVKRMIGRARPLVIGVLDPSVFVPFKWTPAMQACRPGTPPRLSRSLVAIGALWPRPRIAVLIYAL